MLQAILKLQMLTKHWTDTTPTSDVLHYSFEAWTVTLGTTQPHLLTTAQWDILAADNWWKVLYKNLAEYDQDFQFHSGLEQEETEIMPYLANCLDFNDLCTIN